MPAQCGHFVFYQLAGGGLVKAAIPVSASKVRSPLLPLRGECVCRGCLGWRLLLPSPVHFNVKKMSQGKPLEGKLAATFW